MSYIKEETQRKHNIEIREKRKSQKHKKQNYDIQDEDDLEETDYIN